MASTSFSIILFFLYISFTSATTNNNKTCKILETVVNGCSTPLRLNIPHRIQFTPACNKHDVCYRCGNAYNWTQTECDKAFKKEMYNICLQDNKTSQSLYFLRWWKDTLELYQHILSVWKKITKGNTGTAEAKRLWKAGLKIHLLVRKWYKESDSLMKCNYGADVYYEAVKNFGVYAYRTKVMKQCSEKCVKTVVGNPQ